MLRVIVCFIFVFECAFALFLVLSVFILHFMSCYLSQTFFATRALIQEDLSLRKNNAYNISVIMNLMSSMNKALVLFTSLKTSTSKQDADDSLKDIVMNDYDCEYEDNHDSNDDINIDIHGKENLGENNNDSKDIVITVIMTMTIIMVRLIVGAE